MTWIFKGGQWQNGSRAGELYIDCKFHTERELVGFPSHNEDWDDLPQRWLAIMNVANARVWETERLRKSMQKNNNNKREIGDFINDTLGRELMSREGVQRGSKEDGTD